MVVAEGLSVRQLEMLVRRMQLSGEPLKARSAGRVPAALDGQYLRLQDCLQDRFGGDVSVRRSASGKGSLTVRFRSEADVEKFLQLLDD